MSALAIFKAEQAAPLSVEALLGAATKKSAKSNSHRWPLSKGLC